MSITAPPLLTVGQLTRQLHVPLHRVEYIIRSRDIRPMGRAGNARVFSPADLALVASELRRIDASRGQEKQAHG